MDGHRLKSLVDVGRSLVVLNGAAYFLGNWGVGAGGLWKTDGTEAGTVKVKDIDTTDPYPSYGLTRVGNSIYFIDKFGSDQTLRRALLTRVKQPAP